MGGGVGFFFSCCFHFIWGWFWCLLNAFSPNPHSKIQQQVRLLFTLPWRILAPYFLFKIMEELFEVKHFIGIKYSVGWQSDFSHWEVKRKKYGSFYSNNIFFFPWYSSSFLKPDCKQVLEKNVFMSTQDFSSWFQVQRDLDRPLNNSRRFRADLALILLSHFSASSIVLTGV